MMAFRAFSGNRFHGVFRENLTSSERPSRRRKKYSDDCDPVQGAIAPS